MKTFILTLLLSLFSTVIGANVETVNTEDTKSIDQPQATTYAIRKFTLSSGGGVVSNGIYSVTSSIGQIDAGHNASAGVYSLTSGFLAKQNNQPTAEVIFANSFE